MLDDFKIGVNSLGFSSSMVFIGSCFSEHISAKLLIDKLNVLNNPFGVIFHPEAILNSLNKALNKVEFNEKDFFNWDNYWFCYDIHSELSDVDLNKSIEKANQQIHLLNQFIQTADILFITFGSAWGYEFNEKIVANCHQQHALNFTKKLMDPNKIQIQYNQFFQKLKTLNPTIEIILTVSPVRHYKDGIIENQQSKSILNSLCHLLVQQNKNVHYLPVYEYVIDVLRDYKYFKADLVHPNELAINLTYQWFKKVFFSDELIQRTIELNKIQVALEHKSLRPMSESYKKFQDNLAQQIKHFENKYQLKLKN